MRYAEVAVDAPLGYGRTLSYSVPPRFDLEPGQMVWAPLGPRPVRGIVFELTDHPQVEAVKDVLAPVDPSPLITPAGLELARWVSDYYLSSLYDAVSLMLPPGFENRVRCYLNRAGSPETAPGGLTAGESAVLETLTIRRETEEKELLKGVGAGSDRALRALLRRGLVERRWQLPRPRLPGRFDCFLRAEVVEDAEKVEALLRGKATRQLALYRALARTWELTPLSVANKEYGAGAVAGLLAKGLLSMEWVRAERAPTLRPERGQSASSSIRLTPAQERALGRVTSAMAAPAGTAGPFLLHGVTGSGKTEVYIRALERCVSIGKRGIYLVPEISMTPQTMHRLNARFPGRVAALHSGLTSAERFEQWWRIREGEFDVVAGPRSALFAPVADLGIVVMDEEHEWAYKQQDASPTYHAREVARKLCELSGAVMLMGSATPDVGTYHRAKLTRNALIELPGRVTPEGGHGRMPLVQVCDMRQELKEGNRSIFSRGLSSALVQCTNRGEQAVLFLNRRGSSSLVQCRDCGDPVRCRSCSVTLTYHASLSRLVCHHCNRRSPLPRACPQCRSPRIRYLGVGSQRVEDELQEVLPGVKTLRWDRDAARSPRAHENILERFLRGEAQVLIGTQMVAKGLHAPGVTLVGVMLADIGLNLPDVRASERAFQLLCQVAGRAGRGERPGVAIVQTYAPTHYAIEAAAKQSYHLFYEKEVRYRWEHANPPFNKLVHMVCAHKSADACQREAARMGCQLRQRAYSMGLSDLHVVGPAPAFPPRVRGRFRWHIILKGRDPVSFMKEMTIPQGWTIDVDPVSVL